LAFVLFYSLTLLRLLIWLTVLSAEVHLGVGEKPVAYNYHP